MRSTQRALLSLIMLFSISSFSQEKEKEQRRVFLPRSTDVADEADRAIATFMQADCTDREQAVLYVPRTGKMVAFGKYAGVGGVTYDRRILRKIVNSEFTIIEAHCHIVNFTAIEHAFPAFREVLHVIGPRAARERFWLEIPSPTDIQKAIGIEREMLSKHPRGSVAHRIVVIESGLPPRVIRYGLAPATEQTLRASVGNEKKFAVAARAYDSTYILSLSSLDDDRCKPFEIAPSCTMRSVAEAVDAINAGGLVYVRDAGYVE